MKKIIIWVVLFCTLFSVSDYFYFNSSENIKIQDITSEPTIQKEEPKAIAWPADTKFTYCNSLEKYQDGERIDFFQLEDVKLINEKGGDNLPAILEEYCKTEDSKKYIFYASDKVPYKFGRYDKDLDKFEIAETKTKHIDYNRLFSGYWGRNYGDNSLRKYSREYVEKQVHGLQKREGTKIPFIYHGYSLSDKRYIGDWLNKDNTKYCTNGLTAEGKNSVCFADVYFKYDFVENVLYEDKICSYYIDDGGKIKTLQKCIKNEWK